MKNKIKVWVLSLLFPTSIFAGTVDSQAIAEQISDALHTCDLYTATAVEAYQLRKGGVNQAKALAEAEREYPEEDLQQYVREIYTSVYRFSAIEFQNITQEEWADYTDYECMRPRLNTLRVMLGRV